MARYQNHLYGFMVNDEPFLPIADDSNVKSMKELKEGKVPKELAIKYKKNFVVGIIDKTIKLRKAKANI